MTYQSREPSLTYDDPIISHCQPDVYTLAGYLAQLAGHSCITDLGCGRASKLLELKRQYGFYLIGLDTKVHTDYCRAVSPGDEWIAHDLEQPMPVGLPRDVVICADVVEHLGIPANVLHFLSKAKIAVISTPEREAFYGKEHQGPPPNIHHVREWNMEEFRALLERHNIRIRFMGLTRSHGGPFTMESVKNIIAVCGAPEAR